MKLLCVWLLVTLYLSVVTSANVLRSKRDLVRIQNFFKWIFGSNEINTGQIVPSDSSENDSLEDEEIYITPSHENIYFGTEPWTEVKFQPHVYAEVPYPRLRPIESNRYIQRHFNEPIVIRNYPPEVVREFSLRDYDNEKRMYPVDGKLPLCKVLVAPLYYETTGTEESCVYGDSAAIISTARQPLPRPPLYIQNRLREILINHQIPSFTAGNIGGGNLYQDEIVVPSPKFQNVEIFKYPPQGNLPRDVHIQVPVTQNSYKRTQQLKSVLSQDVRINQLQVNPSVQIEKKVQFTRPVHSSYSYKMLYHNQPHKNMVVKMENTHDIGVPNEKSTELSSLNAARISRINPPSRIEESVSRVVSSDKRVSLSNQSEVMSDLPLPYKNNVAHDVSEERMTSQRKLKTSVRVNDRGDIPDISL